MAPYAIQKWCSRSMDVSWCRHRTRPSSSGDLVRLSNTSPELSFLEPLSPKDASAGSPPIDDCGVFTRSFKENSLFVSTQIQHACHDLRIVNTTLLPMSDVCSQDSDVVSGSTFATAIRYPARLGTTGDIVRLPNVVA